MEINSAVELINSLVYKPGWRITATDHSNRFEGTVTVRFDYPARNSNRSEATGENADNPYPNEIPGGTYATFPLIVEDCDDACLYERILEMIVCIEEHEAREFLRVQPTGWAPFHPHRVDGMRRWAAYKGTSVTDDLKFGIA